MSSNQEDLLMPRPSLVSGSHERLQVMATVGRRIVDRRLLIRDIQLLLAPEPY
jgi:hypothetical protein